jgi:hypothetical protein
MIVISGIPGSGKHKLGESLTKLLSAEGLPVVLFKTSGGGTEQVKFSSNKFISHVLAFREQSIATQKNKNYPLLVVAVLPSYNHLKKVIFELKKANDFNQAFDIRSILTKVHARNFYMTKNRNTYQFLIENCMKGVAHAVLFERPTNVSQSEA